MRNSIVSSHRTFVARASKHSRRMARAAQDPPDSQARDCLATRRPLARPTRGYCKSGDRAIKGRVSVREYSRRRACRLGYIKATRKKAPQPRVSSQRGHESSPYRNLCCAGRCGYASKLRICQSKITRRSREAGPCSIWPPPRGIRVRCVVTPFSAVGRLAAKTYWRYLDIAFLGVSEKHRAQDLGTKLMDTPEDEARAGP